MSVTASAPAAVLLAAGLDRLFAEPPSSVHPVARFGAVVAVVDREWARPQAIGTVAALALPLLAAAGAALVVAVAAVVHPFGAFLLAGTVLFSTTSLRMLVETAAGVSAATESDLHRARRDLRALAGRDAAGLSSGQVRSAAVESAAENLADGLVAPLGAFAVVAVAADVLIALLSPANPFVPLAALPLPVTAVPLALAAAAAAWVKAVNTLDSMLGYRSKPVGRASARLDDLAMWLPARTSALLLALAAGSPGAVVRARPLARRPPSPNSGWPMGTLAAVLGVRLEKPGVYVLDAGPDLPTPTDAVRGVRTVNRAGWLAVAAATALVALPGVVA